MPRLLPLSRGNASVAAVILCTVVASAGCKDERRPTRDVLPIAVPAQPVTLEDIVALARTYTTQSLGAGPIWLHHVDAPRVHRDGTVVIDPDAPIEVTFGARRAHGPEICQTLALTSRGWTGRNDGCDYRSVDARCTAREVIARAAAPGTGVVALRLEARPSTDAVAGAALWRVEPDGGATSTVADDCGVAP